MRLLEVIPIARNIFKDETLSYFTAKEAEIGSLVLVPLRKKNVPALVISVSEVEKNKAALRRAAYQLKNIKSVIAPSFLTAEFLETSKELSLYYVSPQGLVIKNLLPQRILTRSSSYFTKNKAAENKKLKYRYGKLFCQGDWADRAGYYKSIVREEFARGASVFFCLPTISDAETVFEEMRRGIEEYALLIHSALKAKEFDGAWNKATSETHPLLIIGTGIIFSLPRTDIGAIIIEREASNHYKLKTRPYPDIRKVAEFFHNKLKNRLIFGGDTLRSETFFRKEIGELEETLPFLGKIRLQTEGAIASIEKKSENFISEELKNLIKESALNKERLLLFINRRGHSPSTVCQDCARTILCPRCEAPMVLHLNPENDGRKMLCHHCLFAQGAPLECPYCKSWRLKSFGIGIQKALEELQTIFPQINFIRFDSDVVKNRKQGGALLQKFLTQHNQVLVATELILSYITAPLAHVGIISIDGLFTIPDFRINERVFSLLLYMRSLANKKFLIQTRLAEHEIFKDVIKGDISGFYRKELSMRKSLSYPPFSKFIKLTRESIHKDPLQKEITILKEQLKKYSPIDFPAFISKVKNKYRWNLLLKVEPKTWPDKYPELASFLQNLGPQWRVEIDPENLL